MLGQRARPVRPAAAGKPTPETVHGVPPPTQHIPFGQDAANLFFQLVSSRYEHASLILTSNLPQIDGETSSATMSLPPP